MRSTVTLKSQSQAQSRYDGKTAQDVINSIAKEFSVQFKDLNPLADVGTIECVGNCQSAKDSIARLKKHLRVDQLASTSSAKAFIIALNAFRSASTKEILTVLKGNKKILPQLMDILGVTQTKASLDAAFQFIKFDVEDGDTDGIEIVERFLLSLGISSHPDSYALKKLVDIARKKIPSTKIEQTIILTVGALMKSVNIISTKNEVVLSSLKFIVDKLEKCKDDACRHLSLKALKNFGDPIILPVIEKFMQYGGKVTVTALKALSTLKKQFISMKIKAMLKDICFEVNKKQDSSSRILAADILLQSDPSECFVKRLIRSLSDQKSEELSTYVLKRIQELTEQLPELGIMVQRVMKEMSVGNYNTLAQKGLSVAMTNPLFSSKDVSTNYGMHTELLKGGMLKTTSFDVDVFSGSDNFILISVGAFAAGLESFVGESSAGEDEEQEDATCGMQITLLGVTLRPYKFFTGQGELMSLVWSGAGSEPTPALQGNFILNDVANQIVLHNGITVQNTLQGVISTDLSGSVQISLWNRNAESVVNNKGAFLLRGTISVQTDLVNTFVQYDVDANAALNFITSLDFYNSPSRMCMEMDQPPFVIRHNVTKIEGISSVKHNKKKTYQKVTNVLGRSYALPQAIYKACRSLKAS
ncbi:Microsomal triglyceride transfer protein large subunit [Nymphon striatum]|nr:Microsomal triglyceride transfer protein large subunit [Nymphon striatum]